MEPSWVAQQILTQELSDAVTNIVARGKDDTVDALRAGADGYLLVPDMEELAHLWEGRYDSVSAQNHALQKALKAIANHGTGLAKVVAQLALKELDRA